MQARVLGAIPLGHGAACRHKHGVGQRAMSGGRTLVIEVRIRPDHFNRVSVGRLAFSRLTAFPQRMMREVEGGGISRPMSRATGGRRKRSIQRASRWKRENWLSVQVLKIVPSMPAEVFARAGEQATLSLLMRPLPDRMMGAFPEQ